MDHNALAPYLNIRNKAWAQASLVAQSEFVLSLLSRHEALMAVVEKIQSLPGAYVGGGSLPQIVWNHFHGFSANHGIGDFDVVYFNAADLTEATEQAVQAKLELDLRGLPVRIEAINEARVHLWYAKDFGKEMAPYTCTEDAIYCFPTTASATGVRKRNGKLELYAPHGLTDLLGMVVRPNRVQITEARYHEKAARWRQIWPELSISPW